ncbi:Hypothetical protein I595_3139 [Croceitalea dokdonensis DOKDO 023]|uniref:DUF4842 domain-containing protein n=1 Tax=Croceitalea dokdonensis DOKDO 023 TaxID=1300341 RepID=A0A0P7AEK6_9FLAO|nr:LruC domain-containing protein [Croceitalea dokdonensis]KPM30643.1 Hypothetical protein I595_3139 [Croceitalea dokdonensis DOKDO 023]
MQLFKTSKNIISIIVLLSMFSCIKDNLDNSVSDTENGEQPTEETLSLVELQFPEGFNFETAKQVTITVNDLSTDAVYTLWAYNDMPFNAQEVNMLTDEGTMETVSNFVTDEFNQVLFTGKSEGGTTTINTTIPSYYNKIYLRRKEGNSFDSQIIDIVENNATYTYTISSNSRRMNTVKTYKSNKQLERSRANRNVSIDSLYAVNGSGQLFTINPLTGNMTDRAAMPQGSYTAAVDQTNQYLYSIGRSNPYPLMRYDMINDTWTTIGNVGMGGPRLDYREEDGLLYFSSGAKVYTIDASNASVIATWDINNLDVTGGGDLAFAADGTLFLSSFGGLYRLDLDENNSYWATRISADNLPFNPTSMTFDSNNELWLASNGASSNLIIMDTVTGGWEYVYGPNSTSGIDFGRTINDLTTFTFVDEDVIDPDTDGDGITDSNDSFPDDADKAFEQFTPSKYGWGTIAFEDLWPFRGDYDFNDTAVNYRVVAVLNSENEAVQLDIYYEVTSDGAGLTNGFGISLENVSPEKITLVTGTKLTENYINIGPNGLEENQTDAVVVLFDDHEGLLNVPGLVSISFDPPITTDELGLAPFNPFLIVGKNRAHEIHLPNQPRTDLGTTMEGLPGVNQDVDGDFKTDSGLPWAISIIHDFKVPEERVPVNQAYNFFEEWATSGGNNFADWYKDNLGYRNSALIKD